MAPSATRALQRLAWSTSATTSVQALFNELLVVYGVNREDVRLLVRPSGTEPLVRVMIEALNAEFVEVFAERLKSLYGA